MNKPKSGDKIREFFENKLPEIINSDELRDLLFLVLEEKPGALIMSADEPTRQLLQRFCNEFDMEIKIVKGEKKSLLDRLMSRDNRFLKDSIFIAHDRKKFEILENSEGDFCGFSNEAVGEFLGYPEGSIEYFTKENIRGEMKSELEMKLESLKNSGVIDQEDINCLKMISYMPRPEKESILEAVDEGRKRKQLIKEYSLDLPTT